jgi:hypothetical protein
MKDSGNPLPHVRQTPKAYCSASVSIASKKFRDGNKLSITTVYHGFGSRFPNPWYTVVMDNLFPSRNFFEDMLTDAEQYAFGVCRIWGRGLPESTIQKAVTKINDLLVAKGTLKVSSSEDFRVTNGMPAMRICSSNKLSA